MLIDTQIYQDLHRLFGFLQQLDEKTDRRYNRDTNHIGAVLTELNKKVEIEIGYRNSLQSYKMQGFTVEEYINKAYQSFEAMDKEIRQVLQNCQNLIAIATQYRAIAANVPPELRQKFEQLLKKPAQYLETVSLWSKIQASVR